jgi:hypothetical protein
MTIKKTVLCGLLGIFLMTETSEARIPKYMAEIIAKTLADDDPCIARLALNHIYTNEGSRELAILSSKQDCEDKKALVLQLNHLPKDMNLLYERIVCRLFPSPLQTSCMAIIDYSSNLGFRALAQNILEDKILLRIQQRHHC